MTNIKNIGKELLGKTLNSFHKSTGLQSVERNNEMQTKILQGIYSQVDNEYLEKTEEGSVIHLDGSGDGVVELDSVQGNSMVNLPGKKLNHHYLDITLSVPKISYNVNTRCISADVVVGREYTIIKWPSNRFALASSDSDDIDSLIYDIKNLDVQNSTNDIIVTKYTPSKNKLIVYTTNESKDVDVAILEGDWTDKEVPPYFEGLQSCFEEKKVGDKYEVEILSSNKNLFDTSKIVYNKWLDSTNNVGIGTGGSETRNYLDYVKVKGGTTIKVSGVNVTAFYIYNDIGYCIKSISLTNNSFYTIPSDVKYIRFTFDNTKDFSRAQVEYGNMTTEYVPHKSNKIKLYLNEPLRGLPNGVKDRLCIVDDKLTVERNCGYKVFDGVNMDITWHRQTGLDGVTKERYSTSTVKNIKLYQTVSCNTLPSVKGGNQELTNIYIHNTESRFDLQKLKTDNRWTDIPSLNNWFKSNPTEIIYPLAEPFYEEVTNEYGEPVLLEGYENGTVYIDSIIPPTTTVKYTQKFASRNAVKELSNNNAIVMHDINANIVPYMMDIDMMIMEKEMSVMNQLNINKIMKMEVLDMTSMQKRTKEMLERLIKGQTLTEQECRERVLVYLEADKITAEQANELMLLIAEVYK